MENTAKEPSQKCVPIYFHQEYLRIPLFPPITFPRLSLKKSSDLKVWYLILNLIAVITGEIILHFIGYLDFSVKFLFMTFAYFFFLLEYHLFLIDVKIIYGLKLFFEIFIAYIFLLSLWMMLLYNKSIPF